MPERKYVTNKAELLAQGQMIVSSNEEASYIHRVECVNFVLGGMPPSEVSLYVPESKNTITSWVKTADEQGFEALHIKKQSGRPPKLSAEQMNEIESILIEDDPEKYGYHVWDGPSLSAFILSRYSVSICVRQCQRFFKNFNMSLVRPQTYPSKGKKNVEAREEFKKNRRNKER